MIGVCHVCEREISVEQGRLARHFVRQPVTGGRMICLGAGATYRPPLAEMKAQRRQARRLR